MADPEPARGPAQVTTPSRLDRTRICPAPGRTAAMPSKAPRLTSAAAIAIAIAIVVAAAPACSDRALPDGGTPQGSPAGASGAVASGAGGGGGAVTTGADAGGAGGAIGCPPLNCPQIFCQWSRALDERGCETCACTTGPGPNDCEDVLCFDPRPPPPASCPDAKITCVPGGDRCVWTISVAGCISPAPCPAAQCGPIDDLPPPPCPDGSVHPPACTRDPDATCRWHYDCPPCGALPTRDRCDSVAGCQWLMRACSEPTIPVAGCVDKKDIGCSSLCVAPRRCARIYVDSCTIMAGPTPASCADAVCRDTSIAVCAWW